MKKLIVLTLILFVGAASYAAIPSKYAIPEENKIKYFQDEQWWLRKHDDLLWRTSFFYAPLSNNNLFSGVYYRFQNGELVMYDYVAKKGTSYQKLYDFLKSMGTVKKFKGIPYVKSKTSYNAINDKGKKVKVSLSMAALLVSNKNQKRILFVPSVQLDRYKRTILEAHINKAYPKKKK